MSLEELIKFATNKSTSFLFFPGSLHLVDAACSFDDVGGFRFASKDQGAIPMDQWLLAALPFCNLHCLSVSRSTALDDYVASSIGKHLHTRRRAVP